MIFKSTVRKLTVNVIISDPNVVFSGKDMLYTLLLNLGELSLRSMRLMITVVVLVSEGMPSALFDSFAINWEDNNPV